MKAIPSASKRLRRGAQLSGLVIALCSGCGAARPSKELVDARRVYAETSRSRAAQLVPTALVTARLALARAEQFSEVHPGSFAEASLAYVARRCAELAVVQADQILAYEQHLATSRRYLDLEAQLRETARIEALSDAALEEKQHGVERAREELQGISQVSANPYGLVMTFERSALFRSGATELSPSARRRLERVVQLLKQRDADERILVKGPTDSSASASSSMQLSQQRAQAVVDFLIARGVASEAIEAEGNDTEGTEPLASNDDSEHHASNRRVEIVIR